MLLKVAHRYVLIGEIDGRQDFALKNRLKSVVLLRSSIFGGKCRLVEREAARVPKIIKRIGLSKMRKNTIRLYVIS